MQEETTRVGTAAPAIDQDIAGLPAGCTLLTLEGELPVEHLAPGDRVVTRHTGIAVLRRVEVVEATVAMVRVKAGSLGHTRPERDTCIAPGTKVHLRDWRAEALYGTPTATVAIRRLIDGEYLTQEAPARTRLYRLIFDREHIVYADGLEVAA